MKIILTEKINKLGNIGDTVEVATGYARNYLLPNGKALRHSRENLKVFEARKAELIARQETAKTSAEGNRKAVESAKFHMIRQAGDTGHLYGSVSSRDVARLLKELTGVAVESAQVLLGSPIKAVGVFETKIALHPDVIVPIKIYVAQTQDEIEALVAGKILTFGTKKAEEESTSAEAPTFAEATAGKPADKEATPEAKAEETVEEKKPAKRAPRKKAEAEPETEEVAAE